MKNQFKHGPGMTTLCIFAYLKTNTYEQSTVSLQSNVGANYYQFLTNLRLLHMIIDFSGILGWLQI